MSDQRRKALKTIVQLISHFLWAVGLVVGLSGVYLLLNYRQSSLFFSHTYIILPAVLSLCSAVLLVVSGCIGSWQKVRDAPFIQGLFVYLLVVVFCLISTASALAYFHSTKLDSELAPLTTVFQTYTGDSQDPNSQAVDATQEELQCCGVHGYKDWLKTPWFNRTGGLLVPHSCCNSSFPSCNGAVWEPRQLYSKGCKVKLELAIQFVLSLIIWCFPVVFLVELALFLTVGQLMIKQPLFGYEIFHKK
ncbi:tetraspanin 37 [Notolabrus celidotus]|uniref:tetraspanin 37 n=1 Tax=Notolabrus celidotus TaxID=1203425 RepID=UPI00148F6CA3|nr:tetraspanin 37 [Notolabrus celidotus]